MELQKNTHSSKRLNSRVTLLALSLSAGSFAMAVPLEAEPFFVAHPTETCVLDAYETSPGLSDHSVLDCVGRAAESCMMTPGGDTTIGMVVCLDGELGYWEARLNDAYAERMKTARDHDTEMRQVGSSSASIEHSLRAMQRAWVSFREASCLFERAQWMGGTGSGPATMACHMQETARQALKLEGWWGQ